jgi:dolichyl-phosphate beta-glucosyltransferase
VNSFSVLLIPAYNESLRFSESYFRELSVRSDTLRLIFIDDGSTDSTLSLLKHTSQFIKNSEVMPLRENVGKANALRLGFLKARELYPSCSWIGFLDSDGSFYPDDVTAIISLIPELDSDVDAIFTCRKIVLDEHLFQIFQRGIARNVIFKFLIFGWGEHPEDVQSGFKFFRNTDSMFRALEREFVTRWFFEWEILIRLKSFRSTFRIHHYPLRILHKRDGNIRFSNYPHILLEVIMIKFLQIKELLSK